MGCVGAVRLDQILLSLKFNTFVEKSFLNTCSSVPKIPRDQNTTPGTKTTMTQHQLPPLFFSPVNNGIAIKRSKGQRHPIYLTQPRSSAAEKASN
ncbi:hypothetical protein T10_8740 [Trichinella papuae]|uniref:Uncharacterized protein n=1 Tax=Trichinella papuae TaxID=268474 RepID=A0A0V1MVU3_9BILA|nr:hypothetical protein T10_8740 [Trichinella papuae]